MPWGQEGDEDEGKTYKYQYHPGGDTSQPLQNAPNALNEVVLPNVTLPEVGFHLETLLRALCVSSSLKLNTIASNLGSPRNVQ